MFLFFLSGLHIHVTDDDEHTHDMKVSHYLMSGDYRYLFWNGTEMFGAGISFNRVTRSGFLVVFLTPEFPNKNINIHFKNSPKIPFF